MLFTKKARKKTRHSTIGCFRFICFNSPRNQYQFDCSGPGAFLPVVFTLSLCEFARAPGITLTFLLCFFHITPRSIFVVIGITTCSGNMDISIWTFKRPTFLISFATTSLSGEASIHGTLGKNLSTQTKMIVATFIHYTHRHMIGISWISTFTVTCLTK